MQPEGRSLGRRREGLAFCLAAGHNARPDPGPGAQKKLLGFLAVPDQRIGGLDKGQSQVSVAVLAIIFAFRFAIADAATFRAT